MYYGRVSNLGTMSIVKRLNQSFYSLIIQYLFVILQSDVIGEVGAQVITICWSQRSLVSLAQGQPLDHYVLSVESVSSGFGAQVRFTCTVSRSSRPGEGRRSQRSLVSLAQSKSTDHFICASKGKEYEKSL